MRRFDLVAAATLALLSSAGAGTTSPSPAPLYPTAGVMRTRAGAASRSMTSISPRSFDDTAPSSDDEAEENVSFSCENYEIGVRYLVGSTSLLPRPGNAPAEFPTATADLLSDLFGLFTVTNNRDEEMNGWQMIWSWWSPSGQSIGSFRGALPVLAEESSGATRVVNTETNAVVEGRGGTRSFSFDFDGLPGGSDVASVAHQIRVDQISLNGLTCTEHRTSFDASLKCLASPFGCQKSFCCGASSSVADGLALTDGGEARIERLETSVAVFDDSLAEGWWDCSWDGLFFIEDPGWIVNSFTGSSSVAANVNPGGGLSLCTRSPFGSSLDDFGLSFFVVGSPDASAIEVVLSKGAPDRDEAARGDDFILALTDEMLSRPTTFSRPLSDYVTMSRSFWVHVLIPFGEIAQPTRGFDRISFVAASGQQPIFLLDDIQIVKRSADQLVIAGVETDVVFQDELAAGWEDCSWSTDGKSSVFVSPPWVANAHSGAAAIAAHINANGALSLCSSEPFGPAAGHSGLSFWIRADSGLQNMSIVVSGTSPEGGSCDIDDQLRCDEDGDEAACGRLDPSEPCFSSPLLSLAQISDTGEWSYVGVPFSQLADMSQSFDRITFHSLESDPAGFALDDLTLLRTSVTNKADSRDAVVSFLGPKRRPVLVPLLGQDPQGPLPDAKLGVPAASPPLPAAPTGDDGAGGAQAPGPGNSELSSVVGPVSVGGGGDQGGDDGGTSTTLVAGLSAGIAGAVLLGGLAWWGQRRGRSLSREGKGFMYGSEGGTQDGVLKPHMSGHDKGIALGRVPDPGPEAGGSSAAALSSPSSLPGRGGPAASLSTVHAQMWSRGSLRCAERDDSSLTVLGRVLAAGRLSAEATLIARRLHANEGCREIDREDLTYDDDDLLGSGGFGTVYKGSWRGKPVAVKVLFGIFGVEQKDYEDFLREVEIQSRMHHPCIIKFCGACFEPPCCFVTELAEGGSLHSRLHGDDSRGLSYEELLTVAIDVADAMTHLHPKVVHRDLKPSNVLLTADGRALVADFGVSRNKDRTYLSTKHIHVGTIQASPIILSHPLQYMAPELFNNGAVGERCDVFSFAILLWECYTRRKPYEGLEPVHVLLRMSTRFRHTIPDGCPVALRSIIARCWEEDPRKRPAFRQVRMELEWELRRVLSQAGRSSLPGPSRGPLGYTTTLPAIEEASPPVYSMRNSPRGHSGSLGTAGSLHGDGSSRREEPGRSPSAAVHARGGAHHVLHPWGLRSMPALALTVSGDSQLHVEEADGSGGTPAGVPVGHGTT